MTFISFPLFLGGLVAAGIPILLHLMMRGVPKRLDFPPLRFLQKKEQQYHRALKLRHLLLLFLRVSLLILLGLALARPGIHWGDAKGPPKFLSSFGSQESPVAVALVIDNSPRMNLQKENKTRLDVAQEEACWVLSQLPEQSEIAVVTGLQVNDTFEIDSVAALERVQRIAINDAGRSVGESVREAIRVLKNSELESKELYIFSDLTAESWPNELAASVLAQQEGIRVYIFDVGVEKPHNSGIAKLTLSEEVLSAQSPLQCEIDLVHYGNPESRIVELVLQDPNRKEDEAEQRRSSQIVEFSQGTNKQTVHFLIPTLPVGLHQGVIRFTTSDAFPQDDQVFLTVEVRPAWKILLVASEPTKQHARFFREAIDPSTLRQASDSAFQTEVLSWTRFQGQTGSDWDKYQAICLLDPLPLEQGLWKKLADYVSRGHGLGLFFGRNANPPASFQDPVAVELIGGKLSQISQPESAVFFAPDNLQVPVLSAFHLLSNINEIPWELQPVFTFWQLTDWVQTAVVEIKYSDGKPAILTRSLGQGVVLSSTTPFSDSPNADPWNLLPVGENSWIFVGLAEGIARLLVGAAEQSYNFYVSQTATLHLKEKEIPPTLMLTLPDGNGVRLTVETSKRQVRFGGTEQIGQYRLRSAGTQGLESGFSINLKPESLSLTRIDSEQLDKYFGEKKYQLAQNRSDIERVVSRGRTGWELFPYITLLICALFLCENILSNRFYTAQRQ
ncbi:MAG: BatA domain-containing protein [Thermoguttaceae bacterium]